MYYWWSDVGISETYFLYEADPYTEPICIGMGEKRGKVAWHFYLFDPRYYESLSSTGKEIETVIKGFKSKTEMQRKIADAFA